MSPQVEIIDYLNEKWNSTNGCPLCGNKNWNVSNKIYELREFNDGNLVVGNTSIFPVIPVSCENCGNSVMINALIAGAVDSNQNGND